MNTPNNQRRKESVFKIKKVFAQEIQIKELNQITVSDVVKKANINRSTFYTNFVDIYDLADTLKKEMYENMLEIYKEESITQKHSYNYLKMFQHIKKNQIYYKTMFKLNFDFTDYYNMRLEDNEAIKYFGTTDNIEYHIEFFKAGLNAIIKRWLYNGCIESPETLNNIINTEYKGRTFID